MGGPKWGLFTQWINRRNSLVMGSYELHFVQRLNKCNMPSHQSWSSITLNSSRYIIVFSKELHSIYMVIRYIEILVRDWPIPRILPILRQWMEKFQRWISWLMDLCKWFTRLVARRSRSRITYLLCITPILLKKVLGWTWRPIDVSNYPRYKSL